MIAAIRLDDKGRPAGPGVVIGVGEDIPTLRRELQDRDGTLDEDIRFWWGYAGIEEGDRVEMGEGTWRAL